MEKSWQDCEMSRAAKLLLAVTLMLAVALPMRAQSDPTLVGMIVAYTKKAEKQLRAQKSAMALQTTGHIWLKEEMDAVTDFQRQFNDYLDSFNSLVSYGAQVYGFSYEIGKLSENIGNLNDQIKRSPGNVMAVALTPKRNGIYRELVMASIGIVNDIRKACMSDSKMTEKERLEIVFGIRPKLKDFNRKLRRLTMAIKYTSLSDVWLEIDLSAKRFGADKGKITEEAFLRWQSNGCKIRPK